ncbi:MAG: hypothetical protein BWY83_01237 [bacterium ADurb.Bin478]|nr:MAG: hypothetical protein BWY83_01237 [bacterium ADurb.Bin478]
MTDPSGLLFTQLPGLRSGFGGGYHGFQRWNQSGQTTARSQQLGSPSQHLCCWVGNGAFFEDLGKQLHTKTAAGLQQQFDESVFATVLVPLCVPDRTVFENDVARLRIDGQQNPAGFFRTDQKMQQAEQRYILQPTGQGAIGAKGSVGGLQRFLKNGIDPCGHLFRIKGFEDVIIHVLGHAFNPLFQIEFTGQDDDGQVFVPGGFSHLAEKIKSIHIGQRAFRNQQLKVLMFATAQRFSRRVRHDGCHIVFFQALNNLFQLWSRLIDEEHPGGVDASRRCAHLNRRAPCCSVFSTDDPFAVIGFDQAKDKAFAGDGIELDMGGQQLIVGQTQAIAPIVFGKTRGNG